MAEQVALEVQTRDGLGKEKVKQYRTEGLVPAVFYGKGAKNINLLVNERALNVAVHSTAAKMNALFQLNIKAEGKDKQEVVLIHDYQINPLTDRFVHVDFMKVNLKEKIHAKVPLHVIGVSPAVKAGGILVEIYHDLSVKCLPNEIPDSIEIDISILENIGDHIKVKDLEVPNVEIELQEEAVLVHIEKMRKEEVIEEAPAEGEEAAEGEEGAEGEAKEEGEAKAEGKEADKGEGKPEAAEGDKKE